MKALWRDLPLLNILAYAALIAHAELVNLVPPRADLALSFLLPLAATLGIYALRYARMSTAERLWACLALSVTLGIIGLSYYLPSFPITPKHLREIYELSALLNTLLLLVHAYTVQRSMVWLLLGPVLLYGLLLENGGIMLGYFAELDYRYYLGPLPAPLATVSGWVTVYAIVLWVLLTLRDANNWLRRQPLALALLGTLSAVLLDLQIDPLATAVGFWRWNKLLPTGPMGVPWLNFAAWFCAVFPFSAFVVFRLDRFALQSHEISSTSHRRWLLLQVPMMLVVAAGLFLLLMLILDRGFSGPTFQILRNTLDKVWRA